MEEEILKNRFRRYFEEREDFEKFAKCNVITFEENPTKKILRLILLSLEATYGISDGFTLGKAGDNFNFHLRLPDLGFSDWNVKRDKEVENNSTLRELRDHIGYIRYNEQSLQEIQQFFEKLHVKDSEIEWGTLFVSF